MTPIKHDSNNIMCGPPPNWDDRGGQLRLPVLYATRGQISGVDAIVSFWEPTPEEIAMLLAGGKLQLTCIGGQPPVNLTIMPPNDQGGRILLPN